MTWSEGPLLGLDLESSGVDPLTAFPVSFALVQADEGKIISRRYGLVNAGEPIPEEATKIHGITDADVQERGGPLDRSILGLVGSLVAASDSGVPVVGANVGPYDLTLLDACHRRLTGIGLREAGWNGPVVDIMVIDRALDKFRKGPRKLSNLCEHYGINLANAHHAGADAEAAVLIALALAKRYPTQVGNVELDMLHVQQVGWRRAWAKDFSDYRVRKGEPPLDESAGDWPLLGDKAVSV